MGIYLDQQQTTIDTAFDIGTNSSQKQAQSFKPSISAKIGRVNLVVSRSASPSDNIQCDIFSDSSGSPGALLQSADSTIAAASVNGAVTFNFTSGVWLISGQTYWIVLSRTGALDDDNFYSISVTSDLVVDHYTDGTSLRYSGLVWLDNDVTTFDDLYFQEYYEFTEVANILTNSPSIQRPVKMIGY